jgi:Protein of unknown function with HXXEE motif
MNTEVLSRSDFSPSFRSAVWLFPIAFTLHVLEELPRFTVWAQTYASPMFTQTDYLRIHIAGGICAFIAAAVVWRFPNRIVVFAFLTFMFTPSLFFNTLFHAGATLYFRAYCPGVLTALIVYLPLYGYVSVLANRSGVIGARTGLVSFVTAGVFHLAEVGHNVFKAW